MGSMDKDVLGDGDDGGDGLVLMPLFFSLLDLTCVLSFDLAFFVWLLFASGAMPVWAWRLPS